MTRVNSLAQSHILEVAHKCAVLYIVSLLSFWSLILDQLDSRQEGIEGKERKGKLFLKLTCPASGSGGPRASGNIPDRRDLQLRV